MKRNEIIELNGEEYTLELNRDSFLQIDKICNVSESMSIIYRGLYEYKEEIDDNYNPLEDMLTDEQIEEELNLKEKKLNNLAEKAFFIWLYPNHRLPISKVKELIKPYLEDEEKALWLGDKLGHYLQECVQIRDSYYEERKNLRAQANK